MLLKDAIGDGDVGGQFGMVHMHKTYWAKTGLTANW